MEEQGDRTAWDGPSRIGQYLVLESAGEWARGWYLRCYDTQFDRHVLLKTLFPEMAQEQEWHLRLGNEARVAAAFVHPNIINVFEFGSHEGLPFIAYEALQGESLGSSMGRGLSLRRGIPILQQVLAGLACIHALHLVHRDVNPDGVFVCSDGTAKLTDLWLARRLPWTGHRTSTALLHVAPCYMAPEVTCDDNVDGRSDIFGVGCVLYEMITGQVPFRADSVSEVVSHIVSGALDMGQVPSGNRWQPLRRVVMSALARDPKERSGDASTMANELAAALIELGDDAEWTQKRVPGGVTRN